jgi:hypothetical protein
MQKQKRIGGKFAILPEELGPIFLKLPYSSIALYNFLLLFHKIDEDWKSDPDWVIGTIKARKKEIIEKSSLSEVTFYRKAWAKLIEYGLVKEEKGAILLLKYKRKERDDQLPLELPFITRTNINEENSQNESKLESKNFQNESKNFQNESKLESKNFQNESKLESKNFQNESKNFQNESKLESKNFQNESKNFQNESLQHIIKNKEGPEKEKEISLSLISLFYSTIGQTKISKEKRERALKSFEEIRKDGFTDDQIEFAVKWIPENAKEKPYDFAIVPNMIGQALAAREEYEGKERRKAEKEAEIQAEKSRQEEENRKSAEYAEKCRLVKEKMTPDERNELKEKAIKSLENKGNKRQFINEILIEIEENRILMEDQRVKTYQNALTEN